MKALSELIYEKANKTNSAYKPGTVIPVMYDNGSGNLCWELGYIKFDLNREGELGAWFRATRYNLDHDIGNYDSPYDYIIVKFEDFDPMNDKKNLKNAFIELHGEVLGEFTLL